MTRQKFFEIVLTATISALIAILQNILSAHYGNSENIVNPINASIVGASLQTFRQIRYV